MNRAADPTRWDAAGAPPPPPPDLPGGAAITPEVYFEMSRRAGHVVCKDAAYYRRTGPIWSDLAQVPQSRMHVAVRPSILAGDAAAVARVEAALRNEEVRPPGGALLAIAAAACCCSGRCRAAPVGVQCNCAM